MFLRVRGILGLILVLTALASAKDKKKHVLPAYVLNARTVLVVVEPNAGVSVTDPAANKTAQEEVEKAILQWGWLTPVMDAQTADLIVTVRKGHGRTVEPTIAGGPVNDRPVIVQSTDNTVRVGGQKGRNTDLSQRTPQDNAPHPQTEVGPSEDTFAVYQGGGVERPWSVPQSGATLPRTPFADRACPPLRNFAELSKRPRNSRRAILRPAEDRMLDGRSKTIEPRKKAKNSVALAMSLE